MLSMLSTIVLARLLTPATFGVFAVTLVVLSGLVSINEFGATNAIVRWPGDPQRPARTATTLAWVGSGTLALIVIAIAPWFAAWSHTPTARLPIQVMAIGVIIDGFAAIPGALLTRAFLQQRRAAADFASIVASVTISVSLALLGFGIWALVLGRLVGNAVATLGVLIAAPERPRPGWDQRDARALLRFGLPLVGASALVFVMINADTLVIARILGAGAALGFYAMAFNLASWPLNVLSGMLRRVSLPLFAGHQHDRAQLANSVLGTVQLVGSVAALPCMLLAALAPWIITFAYGRTWAPAASPLVFLATLGWVRVISELAWDALIADGRTPHVFIAQGIWTGLLIPALILGVTLDGIRGAAIAHALIALLVVLPVFGLALHRLGAPVGALAQRIARPVIAAAVVGTVVATVAGLIDARAFVVLVVTVPLGILGYAAAVWRPRSVRAGWNEILGRNPELKAA